jgi:hypothetical protein
MQPDMPMDKRNLFVADLIGYKLDRDLSATEKLKALSGDKRFLSMIINVAKKGSPAMGMTVDTVVQGLQSALSMDIFSFKVNGVDPFKAFKEALNGKDFELEIYMNPLYFSSEIAMKMAVMPMFKRKKMDEAYIEEKIEKTKNAWMFDFEKKTREYIDYNKCVKTVIEK